MESQPLFTECSVGWDVEKGNLSFFHHINERLGDCKKEHKYLLDPKNRTRIYKLQHDDKQSQRSLGQT